MQQRLAVAVIALLVLVTGAGIASFLIERARPAEQLIVGGKAQLEDQVPSTPEEPSPPRSAAPDGGDSAPLSILGWDASASADPDPFAGIPIRHEVPFQGTAIDFDITTLAESVPSPFALDGELSEWPATSDGVLPASAGRGRIWIALTETGLFVAGELDATLDGIALDKVRIDLALAPPVLPPIAYANHIEHEVIDGAWCRSTRSWGPDFTEKARPPTPEDEKDCLAWLSRCEDLRAWIARRFARTLVVDLVRGTVAGVDGARLLVTHMAVAHAAASFELQMPSTSFPETSEMPLRTVRVAARAFSSSGLKGQDATLSKVPSAPRWRIFPRVAPLRLHRVPELVARILDKSNAEHAGHPLHVAVSYVPSPATARVHFFYNELWYTWRPSRPSPQVADIDVAAGRKLITLRECASDAGDEPCAEGGDIDIRAHAAWVNEEFGSGYPETAFVSRRAGAVIDVSAFTKYDPYALVKRTPGVHILDVYQGPAGYGGHGMYGAMTGYHFEVMTMDSVGHFAWAEVRPQDAGAYPQWPHGFELGITPGLLNGVGDLPGFGTTPGHPGVTLWIDPKLEFFGLKGSFDDMSQLLDDGTFDARPHSFKAGYRWNADEGTYVLFGRAVPSGVGDASSP